MSENLHLRVAAWGAARGAVYLSVLLGALWATAPDGLVLGPSIPAFANSASSDQAAAKSHPATFNQDVAPIIFKHCASCHRPGEVAPFPLLSYEDIKKRAKLIGILTGRRYMPPWKPESGYGQFQGSRRLTDAEIGTIQQWVDGGAPEGRPGARPPLPQFREGWQLGQPDLVLQMAKPYTVPADSPEFYRCFVIPAKLPKDRYLAAFEVRPGNRKVVHHAIFVQDPRKAGRRLESEPGSGYPCSGGFGFPVSGTLGLWTAGILPRTEPEGVALGMKKDSDVVLQLHFRPSGKQEQELCAIGLYFAKQPPRRISRDISVNSYAIDVQPGEQNYKVRSFSYVPFDAEALSIFPHAHYLAREMKASATFPDGTVTPLLSIKDWDFDWQEEYWYAVPVRLPQGTRIDMEFTYDNSADNPRNPSRPPQRVTWGEQTTDEMAEVHLRIVPAKGLARESVKSDRVGGAELWPPLHPKPGFARAPSFLPVALVQQGQPARAGETLGDGQKTNPDAAQAHNRSGLTLQQQGDLADADVEFRRALELQPDFAEARNNLGLTLLAEGDTEGAVEQFRRALKTDPQYSTAINSLGLVFLELGRWDEAITQYRALIELNPKIPEVYYNLGTALKHDEDYDGAAEAFGKSLQLDPGFAEAHCSLGEVLWEQGKLDEAAKELRAAVAARSDFLPAYLILGNLLQQQGDLAGALTALEEVLRLDPRNGSAYLTLGKVLKQRRDIDGAAEAFRRAQALNEANMTFQAALQATETGALRRRQGDIDGSVEKLRFALRLSPNLGVAHYQLGLALHERHDDAQAAAEFDHASKLDPRLRPPQE
jgi:Flp pilus assembly protein TadD/mono/diheme cytochrome c family protein